MKSVTPPQTEQALWERALSLAGKNLGELAMAYNQTIPQSLTFAKGFIGQLIELHLGAMAQSKPEPDFAYLGIELKTIPVTKTGLPAESTYVCTAPLTRESAQETWGNSRVRKKLAQVLWIPIEADKEIPIAERRVGFPLLWRPDTETENILRMDWEELTTLLMLGKGAMVSARLGTYLQIRPKAMHSRILTSFIDENSEESNITPRGFYLRTILTKKILAEHYCKSGSGSLV